MKIQKCVSRRGSIHYFIAHKYEKGNVASVDVEFCGYGLEGGCVCNLHVREKSRRRGFARRLMQYVVDQHPADMLYLTVNFKDKNIDPKRLVNFYKKFGFIPDESDPYLLYRNRKMVKI